MSTQDNLTNGAESPQPPPLPPPMSPPQHRAGVEASSFHCVQCGYDLSGTAVGGLCPECGVDVATSLRSPTMRTSGLAIGSFVCGIISISVAICAPFGILGVIAIALYFPAMKQVNQGTVGGSSKGFAIAGLVMGIISTVLAVSCIGLMFIGEMNNW